MNQFEFFAGDNKKYIEDVLLNEIYNSVFENFYKSEKEFLRDNSKDILTKYKITLSVEKI